MARAIVQTGVGRRDVSQGYQEPDKTGQETDKQTDSRTDNATLVEGQRKRRDGEGREGQLGLIILMKQQPAR